jgi:hypothetical protein
VNFRQRPGQQRNRLLQLRLIGLALGQHLFQSRQFIQLVGPGL